MNILINYPPFQQYLIHQLSQTTQYDLQAAKIRIGYRGGLGIHADHFKARSKHSSHYIEADKIDISFHYDALLSGRFIPAKVFIQDARIRFKSLEKKADSVAFDSAPDFQALLGSLFSDLKRIELVNAAVIMEKSDYGLKSLDVVIQQPGDDHQHRQVRAEGRFTDAESAVPFQLEGVVRRPSNDSDNPAIEMELKLTDVPLIRIPWPDEVRFRDGRASTELKISGPVEDDLAITGHVTAGALRFAVVKKGRSKDYDIPRADIDFQGRMSLKSGRIEKLILRMPETSIALTLELDWQDAESTRMDLDINSRSMPLTVFKEIFPTSLVPGWIEARLFPLFTGGKARLDRFRLNGTIDQIKELGRPENADVLEMRLALAEMTALFEGPGLPVTDVAGEVEINRGRLLIAGVNGKFGGSHLRQGTMTWSDLYGESDAFTLGIRGDFLLEDLKRQGKHPLLPRVIRHEVDRFSAAKGQVAADINLFFPDTRSLPALTGRMEMKNSQITHTAFPLPLDLMSGRIDFDEKGPIHLNGNGRWEGSAFEITGTTGRLWNAGGIIPQPNVDIAINADFDLTDVLAVRHMSILPAEFRTAGAGIKTIKGQLSAIFKIRRPDPNSPTRITGTFTTAGSSLVHTRLKLPLDIRQGQMVITDGDKSRFSAGGTWGRSSFEAEGIIGSMEKSMQATVSTFADLNELIEQFYPQKAPTIRLNKPVKGLIRIQKTDARWSFEGEADLDDRIIQLPAVTLTPPETGNRLVFDVGYTPSTGMALKTCRFSGKTSSLTIKGTWDSRSEGKQGFEIVSDPLHLADLGLRMTSRGTENGRLVKGTLRGHVKAELSFDQPEETRVNGELTLRGFLFDEDAASFPYNANLRFKDRSIDILSLTIPLGDGIGILKGQLTGWNRWQGRLSLNTDIVDLPRLIRQLRPPKPGTYTVDPAGRARVLKLLSESNLALEIRARQVSWEGINLGKLQAAMVYRNDRFRVEKAVFTAPDGLIKLSGILTGDKGRGISLLTYIKLDKKPLDAILQGLDIQTDRINGTISLEGGVFLGGRNQAEIIRNLAGKFNIQITEGEVQKSNLIIKILDFLSIQNIFQKRPLDILTNRFYFKSMQGVVTIQNGILTTDRLFMKSPVFNAAAQGRFDLPRDHLNMYVGVQPLNTIDRVVSKIPIIGHILTGKKKTILVYYLKVRGNPEDLVLKQIPFKNLDHAIAGYFKRLFLTPARLWTKMSDTLEEIGEDPRSGAHQPDQTDLFYMGP
ncbi:MAG: AsmA-like C-terminal domain-containing protein [Thermodesulfobacteriota bacterium]|nr:AsmA-like C-terminal domain-containing protein [Thermodesulfobacteriota bacterium]